MSYPYGLQGAPAVGVGVPGLPRRSSGKVNADPSGFPAEFVIVRTNSLIRVPGWATYARLGATGKGGNGFVSSVSGAMCGGGGGGGFAGTNVVKVAPDSPIKIFFDGTATMVDGIGYRLIGGNGADATSGSGAAGGVGSGGDVNFNGGVGGTATGAGAGCGGGAAAGRGGNGGGGASSSTAGGGGNGSNGSGNLSGSSGGGGGVSSSGSTNSNGGNAGAIPTQSLGGAVITVGQSTLTRSGADGGGGSGGQNTFSATLIPATPGDGFALIEFW